MSVDCEWISKCMISLQPTPWDGMLLKKKVFAYLVNKLSTFYGKRKFIGLFENVRHWTLSVSDESSPNSLSLSLSLSLSHTHTPTHTHIQNIYIYIYIYIQIPLLFDQSYNIWRWVHVWCFSLCSFLQPLVIIPYLLGAGVLNST
jgi:hypothetical protein